MRKPIWSRLLIGLMIIVVAACKPISEDEKDLMTAEFAPSPTDSPDQANQPATLSIPTKSLVTIAPPPAPTAAPTSPAFAGWQQIGNPATGLELFAPPDWINLSGRVDTAVTANELGITVMLLANSTRTGDSLLGSKAIGDGAYVAGLISHLDLPPNTPQATLTRLANDLSNGRTPISEAAPITVSTGAGNRVTGSYIDLEGAPLLFNTSGETMRSRLYLFTTTLAGAISQQTQAIFIMSAATSQWEQYLGTFEKMASSILLHNIYAEIVIQDGSANVRGSLGQQDLVNGNLEANSKDVWTFSLPGPRYANLTLSPDNKDIDLILSLVSPTGQTVTRIDNGYAGDTEIMIDNLLKDSGLYVVEVSEFFGNAGRYTLSLVLTEEPLFGGGGRLSPGQTIQGNLARGAQHVWKFNGDAGDLVSIVLTPSKQFDAILDVYGPDGNRLAALDEGFSGDAEVVAGLELPLTGEYSILVRSFAGEGGSYSLSLDEGSDSTTNFYDAGDLIFGQVAQETLRENEAHAWFFNGRAGDELFITAVPLTTNLDLDIWLLDSNINRLAEQDAFLAGEQETIEYVLPSDGQYIILVRDFFGESGRYELSLRANEVAAPDDAGTLTYGAEQASNLLPNQAVGWYFDAEDGDVISIQLIPADSNADLVLQVYDPAGNQVWSVDAAQAGEPEQINAYPIMTDGRWRIVVKEFYGEAAGYTLRLDGN
ncbi:MAG: hypothetical protein H6657_11985 [Ardenticatenaceae bacterium]|nr:hypothetical protein [Ardenticatenaceae bacterium]